MADGVGFEYDCLKGTFYTCTICNYAWRARTSGTDPRSCPNCGSRLWKESYTHLCSKCLHSWSTSHPYPRKCPQCQSSKWSEGEPEEVRKAEVSEEVRASILARYRAGSGAVKISMDTGITFSDVFDVLSESDPGVEVIL